MTLGLLAVFIVFPVFKCGWADSLFYLHQMNPLARIVIRKILSWEERRLSNRWLARVEAVGREEIPLINWVIDEQRSQGIDSFYCLDQYSDDCRQLLHSSYKVVKDDRLWFRSKFTNEYYFAPQYSPVPRYEMERIENSLLIRTGSRIDTWIYLVSRQKYPQCYALEFDYIPHTEMQETLQIDFCCHSLARRFRFNLENNRTLKFDITDRGCFTYWANVKGWDRFKKRRSLPLHEVTRVRLEIIHNLFVIYYNDCMEMALRVRDYKPEQTDWYLIFWNGTENEQSMSIEIRNFKTFIPASDWRNPSDWFLKPLMHGNKIF